MKKMKENGIGEEDEYNVEEEEEEECIRRMCARIKRNIIKGLLNTCLSEMEDVR